MVEIDIISLEPKTVIAYEVLIDRIEKQLETGKYLKRPAGYECRDCGAKILSTSHFVWDAPFPQSGFGKVISGVPYCPRCEKPEIDNSPVALKGSYHNP